MYQAGEYVRCQAIAARRTRRCFKKSRNQAGDVISYTSPYLIPALLILGFLFGKGLSLLSPLSLYLHKQSTSISQSCYTAAPTHVSKVDSRWGGMGQMRRYKRKGRRILTRFLGLWDESRYRRTVHRLRILCDSRSSRTHRSICPIPPQRRLHYLNPHLLSGSAGHGT